MAEYGLSETEFNTAVFVFAHYLGIDLEKEQALLPVAEKALRTLPEGWSVGIGDGDNEGIPYFFNEETGESVWKHPKENLYMRKVKEERKRLEVEAEEKRQRKQAKKTSGDDGAKGKRGESSTRRESITNNKSSTSNNNQRNPAADEVLVFDDFEAVEEEEEEESPLKPGKLSNVAVQGPGSGGRSPSNSPDMDTTTGPRNNNNNNSGNGNGKTTSKNTAMMGGDTAVDGKDRNKKREENGPGFGMSSSDFYSDNETEAGIRGPGRKKDRDRQGENEGPVRKESASPVLSGQRRRSGGTFVPPEEISGSNNTNDYEPEHPSAAVSLSGASLTQSGDKERKTGGTSAFSAYSSSAREGQGSGGGGGGGGFTGPKRATDSGNVERESGRDTAAGGSGGRESTNNSGRASWAAVASERDRERVEKERGDRERGERDRVEKERGDRERSDRERVDRERGDRERGERERDRGGR